MATTVRQALRDAVVEAIVDGIEGYCQHWYQTGAGSPRVSQCTMRANWSHPICVFEIYDPASGTTEIVQRINPQWDWKADQLCLERYDHLGRPVYSTTPHREGWLRSRCETDRKTGKRGTIEPTTGEPTTGEGGI